MFFLQFPIWIWCMRFLFLLRSSLISLPICWDGRIDLFFCLILLGMYLHVRLLSSLCQIFSCICWWERQSALDFRSMLGDIEACLWTHIFSVLYMLQQQLLQFHFRFVSSIFRELFLLYQNYLLVRFDFSTYQDL